MPQTTPLYGEMNRPLQVIALDSRKTEQVVSDKQYLKILQLSDLLSRSLYVEDILSVFSAEISTLIPHQGYCYESTQITAEIRRGKCEQHRLNYRLTIQQMELGELTLYRQSPFSNNEVCQFEDLLCSLVYPLKNGLMYHVAMVSAYRDPLTDINNRAAMDKLLPRELSLAKRHQQHLVLMIMDIDGFKKVNDNYGHDIGDQLLQEVTATIKSELRDTDMMFRYGGDEFVACLPQTDRQGGLDVADRLLSAIRKLDNRELIESTQIGLSIGLSQLRPDDDFEAVFKRVDQALYQAKKDGKHRAVIG